MKKLSLKVAIETLIILAFAGVGATGFADESQLKLEVFVSEPREINTTSVLIMGPTEMMVVCAQPTVSSANNLAAEIAEKGLELRYIFLSHPHLDHYQGAGILKRAFPEAKFVSIPAVAEAQVASIAFADGFAPLRYGGNAAVPSIAVIPYEEDHFEIDGEVVEIWDDVLGDGGFDTPHSALFIPSLNALLPSDTIYFNAHVMMGSSTVESRKASIAQIDRWIEADFDIVIPGHTPRITLAQLTPERALNHTRQYILAYDEAIRTSASSEETVEKMLTAYPDLPHEAALYIGTYLNFQEVDELTQKYLPRWKLEHGY